MAIPVTAKAKDQGAAEPAQPASMMAVIAPAVGWLIPGAGHMIQRRWIRGVLLLISIGTLFVLGLMMQGHIYKANGGDILDILGFIGDLGAGGMYIVTLAMNWGQGAIAFAVADYGTKFMIVAGLLNFIAVADAYHIAIGKKNNDHPAHSLQRGVCVRAFASIVFGITHRETTREMIRYGLYCFAMFLGGVFVAGWAMWLVRSRFSC